MREGWEREGEGREREEERRERGEREEEEREGERRERGRKRGEREGGRGEREGGREGERDKNIKGRGFNCFHNKLIPRMPSVCQIDLSPWNTLLYWKFPLCRKRHTWKLVVIHIQLSVPNPFARTIVRNSHIYGYFFFTQEVHSIFKFAHPPNVVILLATNLITSLNNCDRQKAPSSKGPGNSTNRQRLKRTNIAIRPPAGLKRQ